jgi:hypothetical protein
MLISFWGKNDILTLHLISEFVDEIKDRALPDSQIMFTAHVLPEDGPDFMVTLFHTL